MVNESVSVFISYSHADEAYRKELGIALASLRDEEKVSEWHDRRIEGGERWDEAIKRELDKADIILLLLSADFIASDFIRKTEIPAAMERHQNGSAVVIPVFLRRFDYSPNASYAKLQGYPTNALPVDAWSNRDEAYYTVVQGIRAVVERLLEDRKQRTAKIEAARLRYRTKAKELLADGVIRTAERDTLDELRVELDLTQADAELIEAEEGAPHRKKDAAKKKYRDTLSKVVNEEFPVSAKARESLDGRMRDLGLNADDVQSLEVEIFERAVQEAEQRERDRQQTAAEQARREAEAAAKGVPAAVVQQAEAVARADGTPDGAIEPAQSGARPGEKENRTAPVWAETVAEVVRRGGEPFEFSRGGGKRIKNPSAKQIRDALESIVDTAGDPFAILGKGDYYVQALKETGSAWTVELQNGAIDKHYQASTNLSSEEVIQLFLSLRNGEQTCGVPVVWKSMKL